MESILTAQTQSVDEVRQRLEGILDRNKVGLGWLRFTCSVSYLTYWVKRMKVYFRAGMTPRGRGWNGYSESLHGAYSIIIGYSPVMTEEQRRTLALSYTPNEGFMTVDIPQTALDSLSGSNLLKFWIDVYGCDGVKFTRVDNYYDDYCKLVSPREALDACDYGGVGVPRVREIGQDGKRDLQRGHSKGFTVYFGSRKSEKFVRFYDKFAESDGKQDCYRWEVQLSGKEAEAYQEWFLEVLSEAISQPTLEQSLTVISNAYKSIIKRSISFHEIPVGKAPHDLPRNWAARSPIVWWWKELLAGLEPAKLVVNRVQPSLAGKIAWMYNQVSSTLAMIFAVLEYWKIPRRNWLDRLVEHGEQRWSGRHLKMMEEAFITSPAT